VADQESGVSSLSGVEKGTVRLGAHVADITDIGRHRQNNQDNHLVVLLDGDSALSNGKGEILKFDKGHLLVAVADGMGGHFGGEVASRLCVENLTKHLSNEIQAPDSSRPELPLALRRAVEATHKALFAHAQIYAEKLTMGTTLTAALLHGGRADVAQVGDSRAYLFRDGNLILLTQDQTIGNQLRGRGEDFAKLEPHIQEMLVQAMGAQADVEVIMTAVDLEPGDLLLLCCDGLYKVVSPEGIVETLEMELGLPEKAAKLVTRANEGGGPDNITVILAEICQVESAS